MQIYAELTDKSSSHFLLIVCLEKSKYSVLGGLLEMGGFSQLLVCTRVNSLVEILFRVVIFSAGPLNQ